MDSTSVVGSYINELYMSTATIPIALPRSKALNGSRIHIQFILT